MTLPLVEAPLGSGAVASWEVVAVANIDSPTELASIAGTVVGERRIAYQVVAGDNVYTVYLWDSADASGASSPYVVAGSSGFWIACGGKYGNSARLLRSTLAVGGLATLTGGLTTPAAITSTLATGTAPFTVASTTVVGNLNVSQLLNGTWAVPGTIGSTTPNTGAFTTLTANGATTLTGTTDSTTTATGILVVSGGVGIAKALNVANQTAVCGSANANACFTVGGSTPASIAGTTEYGMFIDFRSDTSATANTRGAFYRAGTSAAAYTTAICAGVVVGNAILGSGSTITRGYGIQLTPQDSSTNNYALVHSTGTPSTGNYFLYDDKGYASKVSGVWSFTDTTDSTSITTGSIIASGGIGVAKRLTLDGATGKTLRIVNSVANAAVAVTFGSVGPTGSTAGNPQGWMRIDINGTDRYMPFW